MNLPYFFFNPAHDLQSQFLHLHPPGFVAHSHFGVHEAHLTLPGQLGQAHVGLHLQTPVLLQSHLVVHFEHAPFFEPPVLSLTTPKVNNAPAATREAICNI